MNNEKHILANTCKCFDRSKNYLITVLKKCEVHNLTSQ